MLIHLIPHVIVSPAEGPVELVDVSCLELGLFLKGGKDLKALRPYPNKHFHVACRSAGIKAMNGILLETQQMIRDFTVTTRWAIAGRVATHRVRYLVLDEDHDALTEHMLLWGDDGRGNSRWPENCGYGSPVASQPKMNVRPDLERVGDVRDILNENGLITERYEVFKLHTMPRARVLDSKGILNGRIPSIDSAFACDTAE
jgi:hypothetical protein